MTHPFVTAWQARDVEAWRAALAPDVVLHSPLLSRPFRGREEVTGVYRILFDRFGQVEITGRFPNGDTTAFHWRGTVRGGEVEGADLVRLDASGQVAEIRVFMRPLVGLGTFTAAMAPSAAPLRPLFRAIDAVATRMSRRLS